MRSRGWLSALLIAGGLLAVIASSSAATRTAVAANPAPGWNLTDIDGNNVSSSALRGRVVVLEFSGTWCEPCRIVEAAFIKMHPEYNESAVVFLAVFIPPGNDAANLIPHRQIRGI